MDSLRKNNLDRNKFISTNGTYSYNNQLSNEDDKSFDSIDSFETKNDIDYLKRFKILLKATDYKSKTENNELVNMFLNDKTDCGLSNNKKKEIREISYNFMQIKETLRTLEETIKINCKMSSEKKSIEKMKEENKELNQNVNKIKKFISEIKQQYKLLIKKVIELEEEQITLINENKKIIFNLTNDYLTDRKQNFFDLENIEDRKNDQNLEYSNNSINKSMNMDENKNLDLHILTTQNYSTVELFNNLNENLERNKNLNINTK